MASFRQANAAEQTRVRLALLENGYVPLPNKDKRCMYEGWNTVRPDVPLIQSWQRALAYQATGIRVENGLCALDVDIDDVAVVTAIWNRAVALAPQLREALIRYGKGSKELWLCRTNEPFSVIFSTTHVRPGEDPDHAEASGHRLEAFGGGHNRQIGAYGAHTMLPDGSGFKIEYEWADETGPVEVTADSLPMITKADVLQIAAIAQDELEKASWPRLLRSRSGETTEAAIYDLTEDMRFDCLDGVRRKLSELAAYADTATNSRCSAGFLGDPTAVNRTRCLISVDHAGVVSVLETANWARHFPADAADRELPMGEKTKSLADRIKELRPDLSFDFEQEYGDAPADFRGVVLDLIENWAWCGSRALQCLPIHQSEALGMSLTNLRLTMAPYGYEREGPKGGIVKVNPVDAWIKSAQRQNVDGYRFIPTKPPGIYAHMGVRAINSYRAPVYAPTPTGAVWERHRKLWDDFLLHLLPQDREREWFLDWLAFKLANPAIPGVAVLMYSPQFGVGRGTLFDLLAGVFGGDYVRNVPSSSLTGQGSQAQYTDWQAECLLITTDEVLAEGEDGTSMAWSRKKAYERLKERIDPRPRKFLVVRKGLPNYQDMTYGSFLLATNHGNAIPIPKGERRVVVLTNGSTPLGGELKQQIDAMRNPELDDTFTATLVAMLRARDLSGFDAFSAPMFDGKALMAAANLSDLDHIVDNVLEDLPFDWATQEVILNRVEMVLTRKSLKDAFPRWRPAAIDRVRQQWHFVGKHRQFNKDWILVTRDLSLAAMLGTMPDSQQIEEMALMSKMDTTASVKLRALRAGLSVVE